jgi:hypothetical protein
VGRLVIEIACPLWPLAAGARIIVGQVPGGQAGHDGAAGGKRRSR